MSGAASAVTRLRIPGLRIVIEPVASGFEIAVRRWERRHPAFEPRFAPCDTWAYCEAEALAMDTGLDVEVLRRPRNSGGAR